MLGLLAAVIIASLAMFIPGVLLAFALLKKTELQTFEIWIIGIIFGLIAPATMTWAESYLISYIHAFTYSNGLFIANSLVLSIVGLVLCYKEGVVSDSIAFLKRKGKPVQHEGHEHQEHRSKWWIWAILVALMAITFYTRMQSIVIAPKFFEFDPYFDMIDAHYILTYGKQLLLDPSAWPVVAAGTNHRLQPLIPYLEAFWYNLANNLQYHHAAFSTNLMSYVGSVYPPVTAALLVFVIFMLLYHEYDERIGLIGAGLTATMPVLLTTFIAGEQLVEPWGIFALFFFFSAYMLAVRNMKDKRLAILAGIAFASNFLGAHYYTLTFGVLILYMLIEGITEILRNESLADFYKMNAIVVATIIIFYLLYTPYQATLQSNLSSIAGIPLLVAGPVAVLVLIALLDMAPKLLAKRKILFKEVDFKVNVAVMAVLAAIFLVVMLFTGIGAPIKNFINISARFTTPSKPLFMTVQEYIPTGPAYPFGSQGFGALAFGSIPILVWAISIASVTMLAMSIAFRKSKTGMLYISIALPLMAAGFSEVKYLPHFGVAFILLFCIALGEALYLASSESYKGTKNREIIIGISIAIAIISLLIGFSLYSFGITATMVLGIALAIIYILLLYFTRHEHNHHFSIKNVYDEHPVAAQIVLATGLFFMFGAVFAALACIYLIYLTTSKKENKPNYGKALAYCIMLFIIAIILALLSSPVFIYGETSSIVNSIAAQATYSANPANACSVMSTRGNSVGYNSYCNVIPAYWLNAMLWINQNVGPNAPRVLAWWDYGDWINWFGNGNAVLRGDNSVAAEDYAVAAQYVLGSRYNYTPQRLAEYMNGNQTKYVLFDQDLISKWGALDFLGCVNINATSRAYALAQGQASNPPVPYVLGTSQCELSHDPEYALIPLSALIPTNQTQQSLSEYCSISNSKASYVSTYLLIGSSIQNSTVCVDLTPNANGVLGVYSQNGTRMNAYIQSAEYTGIVPIQGQDFVQFLMIYAPSGNGTITNAPSEFYDSNYYKGFILGNLPGFHEVYPANAPGINFVNGTYPVRIFAVDNYTGGLPPVPAKDPWVHNNYTMP